MSFFVEREISPTEARRWLDRLTTRGEITSVIIEGEKDPYYLLNEDVALLAAVNDGPVSDAWWPLGTTTQEEVVFLAPLDTATAYGRARALFGFDYIWEVYKPAVQRRWGYYTLPILYGDQLVARLDSKLDRDTQTLVLNGFWLEKEQTGKDAQFAEALARGLRRLAEFVKARSVDVSIVTPPILRRHIQTRMKEFVRRK